MLTAKLILERLDKEGRLLERREQPSRSFTKGFIQMLYMAHTQIQNHAYSMTEVGGVAKDVDSEGSVSGTRCKPNLKVGAAGGRSEHLCPFEDGRPDLNGIEAQFIGIQVGTGTTAPTPTDTAIETRIVHGESDGELEYGGCELRNITFSDPNGEFTIRRYFTNHSGGAITVNEVGIYAVAGSDENKAYSFLIAHDLTGGVAVADGEILRVTYVPQITV